jgi:site-specific DNA recombinase
MQNCVQENANAVLDQTDYQRRYGPLHERYESLKDNLARIADRQQERAAKRESILRFLGTLKQSELLTEFDEGLWRTMVDTVTVKSENEIAFIFKNGMVLYWTI